MAKKEIVLTVIGLLFIVIGIILNEWVLAYFTSDGRIDASGQLLVIRLFNITFIVMGVTIILLRKSEVMVKAMASVAIMVVMFFVLDTMLYFASPWLPQSLVIGMSPTAQVRYYDANRETLPSIYVDNIRYPRENSDLELFEINVKTDSLGYRNPEQYLQQDSKTDVLLIGDSFVWGTEERTIADYLRELVRPQRVYSLGMAGSGISQWRYHYQRYISSVSPESAPEVVVLNYYSGNDATDTQVFMGLQDANGVVDSMDYYTHINFQFLVPSSNRKFALPKLPELAFLTNFILHSFRSGGEEEEAGSALVRGEEDAPVCMHHREPDPTLLNEEVLQQISLAVETIREVKPDTKIVLSYIPTSSGIYGDMMEDCPDYAQDIERQGIGSQVLADHAAELNIYYRDFTPQLREHAQEAVLWSQADHFSPEGYRVYSQFLAGEIEPIMAQ